MDEIITELCREITALCDPERIIQFAGKRDEYGAMRDVSLCVVLDTGDKESAEYQIYLNTDADIAFNLLLYTPDEWESLTCDPQSYASRIVQKGTVIYERV